MLQPELDDVRRLVVLLAALGDGLEAVGLRGLVLRLVFHAEFQKFRGLVLVKRRLELLQGRRDLEALLQDLALALEADISGPLDESAQVARRPDVAADAEVPAESPGRAGPGASRAPAAPSSSRAPSPLGLFLTAYHDPAAPILPCMPSRRRFNASGSSARRVSGACGVLEKRRRRRATAAARQHRAAWLSRALAQARPAAAAAAGGFKAVLHGLSVSRRRLARRLGACTARRELGASEPRRRWLHVDLCPASDVHQRPADSDSDAVVCLAQLRSVNAMRRDDARLRPWEQRRAGLNRATRAGRPPRRYSTRQRAELWRV